jgi:hypothetical protein
VTFPNARRWLLAALLLLAAQPLRAEPPFLTFDAEPTPFHGQELYLSSTVDHGPDNTIVEAPSIEYNIGFAPGLQFHVLQAMTLFDPRDGQTAYGIGDTELGVKWRFLDERGDLPEIAAYPLAEIPTGSAERGTGNGKAWYKLPIWLQKDWGPWTTYGGGGFVMNHARGERDYWFGGWALMRRLSRALTLGTEVFDQGAQAVSERGSTFVTLGGYWRVPDCDCQLLFDGGDSVAGEHHVLGYLGLYWLWGAK